MTDEFRAADLTPRHLGRSIRVDGHEGVLTGMHRVDEQYVQLLLDTGDGPSLPVVGMGAPVAILH